METQLLTLRQKAEAYLHNGHFGRETIRRHKYTWDRLSVFMSQHQIREFTEDVAHKYIVYRFGDLSRKQMPKWKKAECHHIDILLDLQAERPVRLWDISYKNYIFKGISAPIFDDYIKEIIKLKASSSAKNDAERLHMFNSFLLENNLSLGTLNPNDLVQYILWLDERKPGPSRNNYISTTRNFFKYLCKNNMLNDNREILWLSLLQHRDVSHSKVPETLTAEQVENIILSIDRSQGKGKRDYAMTLLAARYGMRGSDITGLRFCNLDWSNNQISFVQQKTKKRVTLPLTEEVGNALIDYIRFARPEIQSPFVFISANAPFRPISSTGIGAKIGQWMRTAGIHNSKIKHGTHVFRHSLATNLMGLNESIPVISEILGHSCTDTTMEYLRISIPMLRKCALEVPLVPSTFYGNLYAKSID